MGPQLRLPQSVERSESRGDAVHFLCAAARADGIAGGGLVESDFTSLPPLAPLAPFNCPQDLNAEVPPLVREFIGSSVDASNSPTSDDLRGGYHEEGGIWGTLANGRLAVFPAKHGGYAGPGQPVATVDPGDSLNPELKSDLTSVDGIWHVHPRGGDGQRFFQPPSAHDVENSVAPINIVVGAASKRVYFYNSTGVIKQISLKEFLKGH